MRFTPILATVLNEINRVLNKSISGTKLEEIRQTINQYAIGSAVASIGVAFVPGAAGVAAALTQAGFVWSTYVKVNKTLGISMSEDHRLYTHLRLCYPLFEAHLQAGWKRWDHHYPR